MGQVSLAKSANEVLGTHGFDDRAFLVTTLREARELLMSMGIDAANGEAQLDHVEDAIEMLSGVRPR